MKTIWLLLAFSVSLGAFGADTDTKSAGRAMNPASPNVVNPAPAPGNSPTLTLQQAGMLYGNFKKRTLLLHPRLGNPRLSLKLNPRAEGEAVADIEKMFSEQNIAVIPDGEHFLMLVPAALTNSITPRASSLSRTNALVPEMSVNFQTAPIPMVLETYADFRHMEIVNLQDSNQINARDVVTFVQTTPLSREEICYALETLLEWRNIRAMPEADGKLRIERVSK